MAQARSEAPGPVLILCIGNTWRGDDGVGARVAKTLRALQLPGAHIEIRQTPGLELLALWNSFDMVILVDAVISGAPPGTVYRFDVGKEPLPADLTSHSTHGFGVAQLVEMARALDRLPRQLIIFGIEACACDHGQPLTDVSEQGAARCVELIVEEEFL